MIELAESSNLKPPPESRSAMFIRMPSSNHGGLQLILEIGGQWKMRRNGIVKLLMVLVCLAAAADAAPIVKQTQVIDPLGADSIMSMPDPEHTAEYYAKMGWLAGGGAQSSLDVSGNWTFELRTLDDKPFGNIDLRLYQYGSLVYGVGALRSGLDSQPVSADGSLAETSTLFLGVVLLQGPELYRFKVGMGDNGVSGSFEAYGPYGMREGIVRGGTNEPRGISPV
jgi:hypothetical protein